MNVKFYAERNGRTYDIPYRVTMKLGNTPMTRRIYKMIMEEIRFQMEVHPEADQLIALVYTGLFNTVTLSMNRAGRLTIITYHPGIMNAVMSICSIRRGGVHNA